MSICTIVIMVVAQPILICSVFRNYIIIIANCTKLKQMIALSYMVCVVFSQWLIRIFRIGNLCACAVWNRHIDSFCNIRGQVFVKCNVVAAVGKLDIFAFKCVSQTHKCLNTHKVNAVTDNIWTVLFACFLRLVLAINVLAEVFRVHAQTVVGIHRKNGKLRQATVNVDVSAERSVVVCVFGCRIFGILRTDCCNARIPQRLLVNARICFRLYSSVRLHNRSQIRQWV